jgi:hypothetical protein
MPIFLTVDQTNSNLQLHIQTITIIQPNFPYNQTISRSINMSGQANKMSQADAARIQSTQVRSSSAPAIFDAY